MLSAKRTACVDRQVMGLVFNIIKLLDPLQDLMRLAWIASRSIKELAPRMRPTGNLNDLRTRVREHRVVAGIGIGMQVARVAFQETWPVHHDCDCW